MFDKKVFHFDKSLFTYLHSRWDSCQHWPD